LSLLVDNCVYEDVTLAAVNKGKKQIRAFIDSVFAAFPDFDMKLSSSFTTGTWAAAEWTMTATHRGDLPGLPATGKHFSVRGASVIELQDGKIRRNSDYWDMATFLKQIGAMPQPN